TGRVQGRLEEVDVEPYAERLQVRVLLLAELLHRKPAHVIEVGSLGVAGMGGEVALGDVADILAVVAPFRQGGGPASELKDPRLHAQRQMIDLGAAIVVIEFARYAPTRAVEERRDGVAQGRLASMPYVQRTGGIGGDELDIDRLALPGIAPAVALARRQHRVAPARELGLAKEEVDESRPGDLDRADQPLGKLERGDQPLGHRAGLGLERLG